MSDWFGPLTDKQFWKDISSEANAIKEDPRRIMQNLMRYGVPGDPLSIYEEAALVSDMTFPDDDPNSSRKNALRHSYGTGLYTQALGGGLGAAALAKLAGYGHELGTVITNPAEALRSPEARQDILHDLNANAIGASMATSTGSRNDLLRALTGMAKDSRVENPPGFFQRDPG